MDSFSYYITVESKFQKIDAPIVLAQTKKGNRIASPEIVGSAKYGGTVTPSDPLVMEVKFNCVKAGAVPVLVTVPLLPLSKSHVSFRVFKICGGFQKKGTVKIKSIN